MPCISTRRWYVDQQLVIICGRGVCCKVKCKFQLEVFYAGHGTLSLLRIAKARSDIYNGQSDILCEQLSIRTSGNVKIIISAKIARKA